MQDCLSPCKNSQKEEIKENHRTPTTPSSRKSQDIKSFRLMNQNTSVRTTHCENELIPSCLLADGFADEYTLMELLGRGNQAEVYKIQRKSDQEISAAKIYHTKEEERLQMISKESVLLSQLNHETIIEYKAFFADAKKGSFIIATEFFEGISFEDFLEEKLRLSLETKFLILNRVFAGLLHMHDHNISHGDFNLKNILINPRNNAVKIIDFGLASKVDFQEYCEDLLTPQGNFKYRAPKEYIFQNSFACDLWGFGLVCLSLFLEKKVSTKKTLSFIESCEEFFKEKSESAKEFVEILKVLMKARSFDDVRGVQFLIKSLFESKFN